MGRRDSSKSRQDRLRLPTDLWRAWPRLAGRLARSRRLAFLTDFDGTLAPIGPHPGRVRLPEAARRVLVELPQSPRVIVGVVSGRPLSELRRLVGLGRIHYVGAHGLEWERPGGRSRTARAHTRLLIRRITAELRRALRGLPHVWVEHKGGVVAVHYRQASPAAARRAVDRVASLVRRYARRLRLLAGKKVMELLPASADGKGLAVEKLLARWRGRRRSGIALYLGDDSSDETVFARLRKHDVGILVGRARPTGARFRLRSPRQVSRFLERLRKVVL